MGGGNDVVHCSGDNLAQNSSAIVATAAADVTAATPAAAGSAATAATATTTRSRGLLWESSYCG